METVGRKFKETHFELAVISGELTSHSQPLEVSMITLIQRKIKFDEQNFAISDEREKLAEWSSLRKALKIFTRQFLCVRGKSYDFYLHYIL